jgi:dipeptidyl aminopeptidase/acylaminoacyl peptidase
MTLLTPEDGDHEVAVSPGGRFLVDSWSRVDLAPIAVIRGIDGRVIQRLEEADISALVASGWRPPERFQVKAADGTTDIYGTLYLPSRVDSAGRYPVLDDVYPGPQANRAPFAFAAGSDAQALAELGFVVVTIDGRGTPHRSKAFHDAADRNLQSGGGLDDHVAGMRQLAARRPWMDLERVGVYGFSGGGFASARAILMYPDFYDVAVSAAGNHDQRGYVAFWGETYQGLPQGDSYAAQANPSLAANLKGKLLLAYGDMDDNVHSALTIQLVDALIKANRDFDLLVMPNRNHGFGSDPYFIRRRWDYFVEHLRRQEPPRYEIRAAGGG